MDRAFPPGSRWAEIVARQMKSEIAADAARDLLAEEYALGLGRLGYVTVLRRRITRPGVTQVDGGTSVYHLLFATDNPTGEKIMNSAANAATSIASARSRWCASRTPSRSAVSIVGADGAG